MRTGTAIAAMLLAATGLLACNSQGDAARPAGLVTSGAKKEGPVLARVGSEAITVDDYLARVEEQPPFVRQRYNTLERKKELLENIVRSELLAQEALRRGFLDDPEVQSTLKKVLVQKLMRVEFEQTDGSQIPEAELRAFYDANVTDYVKPERVRASHVFLAAAKNDANRGKVKAEAQKLLAEIQRAELAGPGRSVFADKAKERSDDQTTRTVGGDLLFRTHEELSTQWGQPVAQAAFALENIGQVGTLVETDQGFHLIKLTGRQHALERTFEQVKGQIQNRLFREKRTKAFEDFVENLKSSTRIEIDEVALAQVGPQQAEPVDLPELEAGTTPKAPIHEAIGSDGKTVRVPVPDLKPAGLRPGAPDGATGAK